MSGDDDGRHDYAGCSREPCRLCEAFSDGWVGGKLKMRDEIVEAADRGHTGDCGCVPCAAVRQLVDVGRDALETEIVASTRHPAGCGCRACALLRAVTTPSWTRCGGRSC